MRKDINFVLDLLTLKCLWNIQGLIEVDNNYLWIVKFSGLFFSFSHFHYSFIYLSIYFMNMYNSHNQKAFSTLKKYTINLKIINNAFKSTPYLTLYWLFKGYLLDINIPLKFKILYSVSIKYMSIIWLCVLFLLET